MVSNSHRILEYYRMRQCFVTAVILPFVLQRIEPVKEVEVPEVDDLQNAASIPLPEDDTAAVPGLDTIQKSPKRSRVKVPSLYTIFLQVDIIIHRDVMCTSLDLDLQLGTAVNCSPHMQMAPHINLHLWSHFLQAPVQPEKQQRSLRSWKWVLLLLAVVAGSTLAMSYRHAWQPPLQKGLRQMEGHFMSQARDVEAYLRGPLLLKAKTWQGILQSQVHSQRFEIPTLTS